MIFDLKEDLFNFACDGPAPSQLFVAIDFKLEQTRQTGACSKLVETHFHFPTSKTCEGLFLKDGYALLDRCHRLLPGNIEYQLYLHMNFDI